MLLETEVCSEAIVMWISPPFYIHIQNPYDLKVVQAPDVAALRPEFHFPNRKTLVKCSERTLFFQTKGKIEVSGK